MSCGNHSYRLYEKVKTEWGLNEKRIERMKEEEREKERGGGREKKNFL